MYLSDMSASQRDRLEAICNDVRTELAPLILGRTLPAWSCCCGAIGHGPAVHGVATAIVHPGERGYPDQMAGWATWSVWMSAGDLAPGSYSYTVGLTQFVTNAVLHETFERHFHAFVAEQWPACLDAAEGRRAPGGDLHGRDISVWF